MVELFRWAHVNEAGIASIWILVEGVLGSQAFSPIRRDFGRAPHRGTSTVGRIAFDMGPDTSNYGRLEKMLGKVGPLGLRRFHAAIAIEVY